MKAAQISLVADSDADVMLVEEAYEDSETPVKLHVVNDGVEELDFLHKAGE